jgi:hypothetical protein
VQICSGSGQCADTMPCSRLRFFNIVFLQFMSKKMTRDSSETQTWCYSYIACAGFHSAPTAAWRQLQTAEGFLGDFPALLHVHQSTMASQEM